MKVKLFYSKIVDVKDGDVTNAYAVNHPGVDFQNEAKLTQEVPERNEHVEGTFQDLLNVLNF